MSRRSCRAALGCAACSRHNCGPPFEFGYIGAEDYAGHAPCNRARVGRRAIAIADARLSGGVGILAWRHVAMRLGLVPQPPLSSTSLSIASAVERCMPTLPSIQRPAATDDQGCEFTPPPRM